MIQHGCGGLPNINLVYSGGYKLKGVELGIHLGHEVLARTPRMPSGHALRPHSSAYSGRTLKPHAGHTLGAHALRQRESSSMLRVRRTCLQPALLVAENLGIKVLAASGKHQRLWCAERFAPSVYPRGVPRVSARARARNVSRMSKGPNLTKRPTNKASQSKQDNANSDQPENYPRQSKFG